MDKSSIIKTWDIIRAFIDRTSARWNVNLNQRTFIILIAIGLPILAIYTMLIRPPADFPNGVIASVPKGASARDVAIDFENQHIVRSGAAFELSMRLMGGDRSLHIGDYQFKDSRNSVRIARALMRGDFGLEPVRIRILDGATVEDIADILDRKLIRFDRAEFINYALPYEGHLYPDTYFFLPTAKPDVIVETLRGAFDREIASIQPDIEKFGKPLDQVIIMASLLEKEESGYEDKRQIAGILWKRLDIHMPLQVDATFMYVIGKGSNQLTLKDLQYDSPFNTYKNKGLPPTPISNPSIDSIRAAINPIKNKYLFYLADRHGNTYYSVTYEEHLRKKRYYLGS